MFTFTYELFQESDASDNNLTALWLEFQWSFTTKQKTKTLTLQSGFSQLALTERTGSSGFIKAGLNKMKWVPSL